MPAPSIDLTGNLRGINKNLEGLARDLGDANGDVLKSASVILARSWRKVLGVSGGGRAVQSIRTRGKGTRGWLRVIGATRSRPGEPPRKQTGQLQKAVAQGASRTGRIVANLRFTAGMLEQGTKGQRKIAARPSAQRALDAVIDQMAGVSARVAGELTEKALG